MADNETVINEDNPELMQGLNQTRVLWEEINTLTNDAVTLIEREIDTLNMIGALGFIRSNCTEIAIKNRPRIVGDSAF